MKFTVHSKLNFFNDLFLNNSFQIVLNNKKYLEINFNLKYLILKHLQLNYRMV
jgi:hypothetical protein